MSEIKAYQYKYLPKDLSEMALLPRVRKILEAPLENHLLLYGHRGYGKTSAIEVLLKTKYPVNIKINASFETSIDVLRTTINEFCRNTQDLFDFGEQGTKVIFLDEIERISPEFQDALKGYMDEYSKIKSPRIYFIATTNHIHKVSPELVSRFKSVQYYTKNDEEKIELCGFIKNRLLTIAEKEQIKIDEKELKKMIIRKFPDFRNMLVELQFFKITGEFDENNTKLITNSLQNDLYTLITKNKDSFVFYDFVLNKIGEFNVDDLLLWCGRPFINYLRNNMPDKLKLIGEISIIVTEYADILSNSKRRELDPVVAGHALLCKLSKLF